jgi:hypothetical protein
MTYNNMGNLDGFNFDNPLIQLIFVIQLVLHRVINCFWLVSLVGYMDVTFYIGERLEYMPFHD